MHACNLVHAAFNIYLVLDNSGITFGLVVHAVLAANAGAVSVCVSAGSVSTTSGTAGALYCCYSFLY